MVKRSLNQLINRPRNSKESGLKLPVPEALGASLSEDASGCLDDLEPARRSDSQQRTAQKPRRKAKGTAVVARRYDAANGM